MVTYNFPSSFASSVEIQKPFCRSGSDTLVNKQEKGRM